VVFETRGEVPGALVSPSAVDSSLCICKCIWVYAIEVASGVLADLARLRAFDRQRILDAIEAQLSTEPVRATRHRKVLAGLVPPFEALVPIWQLSVGEYRVFSDVSPEGQKVYVRAVRHKPAHKTTEEIL